MNIQKEDNTKNNRDNPKKNCAHFFLSNNEMQPKTAEKTATAKAAIEAQGGTTVTL